MKERWEIFDFIYVAQPYCQSAGHCMKPPHVYFSVIFYVVEIVQSSLTSKLVVKLEPLAEAVFANLE